MIKIIKYKEMVLTVKTTIMKDGICYFGEKDISGEFENAFRQAQFKPADQKNTEQIVLSVYKYLTSVGIKPESISFKDVIYKGVKMSEWKNIDITEE